MPEFTIAAADLRIALTTAMAFAYTDDIHPILRAVHFEAAEGVVDILATDRYVASVESIQVSGKPHTFTVPLDTVKRLLALIPKGTRRNPLTGMVTFATRDNDRINATFIGDLDLSLTFTQAHMHGAPFPDLRKLLKDHGKDLKPEAIPAIHFNAHFLARIMRVLSARSTEPVRMSFTTPTKPLVVRHGDSFAAIVVPVRVPADESKAA